MTMQFEVKDPQTGNPGTISTYEVQQQLKNVGYNVIGTSADGLGLTIQGAQGPYELNIPDALGKMGWQHLSHVPENPENDVQAGWRAAITKIPDEDAKRAFLETKMRHGGIEDPKVVGQGRDWYAFNPHTSKWYAITNSPDWEMADLAEGGLEGARFLGSAAGGALGGVTGAGLGGPVGAPLGAAAGAGLGGGAVDIASRGLLAAMDPDFKNYAEENLGSQAADVGKSAGIDAAMFGAGKAIMPARMAAGVISGGLKSTGAAAEAGGQLLSKGAGTLAGSDIGSTVASQFIPGISEATTAGWLGQLPAAAAEGIPRAAGNLAENGTFREIAGDAASQKISDVSKTLLKQRPRPFSLAEEMASKLGGAAPEAKTSARDVFGNAFEQVGGRMKLNKDLGFAQMAEEGRLGAQEAFGKSHTPEEVNAIADEVVRSMREKMIKSSGNRAGQMGERFGEGIDQLATASRGIERMGTGMTKGLLRGAQGAGEATALGGRVLNRAATVAAPLEIPAAVRYGLVPQAEEQLRRRKSPQNSFSNPDQAYLVDTNY